MFKKITASMLILLMATSMLFACSKNDAEKETTTKAPEAGTTAAAEKIDVDIAVLKGATAIGMVKLMDDAAAETTANNYKFSVHGTADEINSSLIKGDLDMACIPCNVASVLYNKSEGNILMAAINTLGVLYIVETGDTIKEVADLKGKTIYATGQGSTPEYTLRYLLTAAEIDPDNDVNIEFLSEATEVAAKLAASDDCIAMLPQPYVASSMTQNDKIRIALDVTEEWEKVAENSTVVTGVLVVRKAFAEENPEVVANFLEEYNASITYASSDVDSCADLLEKYDIFKAAIAKKAMPYIHTEYIDGEEMKTKASAYLTALFDQNPTAIGGTLPAEDFFYIAK